MSPKFAVALGLLCLAPFAPLSGLRTGDFAPPSLFALQTGSEPANSPAEDAIAPPDAVGTTADPLWVADTLPDLIASPGLPFELRPQGVPTPHARKARRATHRPANGAHDLAITINKPGRTPTKPPLLPAPASDPQVVYVLPFTNVMVPDDVQTRVFDQFVDTLNQQSEQLHQEFVILKEGLNEATQAWLTSRKYIAGEVFNYVEDASCCSTEMRARLRIKFFHPNQNEPAANIEYTYRSFFDHDRSTLAVERQKLADNVVGILVGRVLPILAPPASRHLYSALETAAGGHQAPAPL